MDKDNDNNEWNNRIEKQILIRKQRILVLKDKIVKLDKEIERLRKRKR